MMLMDVVCYSYPSFFSLTCSFCALLVMDEDVWSYIRLFLIKEDLSSLCLVIMGKATGGGAGR